MIILKTAREVDSIRKSCSIVAYVLGELYKAIEPGMSTEFLDKMAEELCFQKGGTPAFKNYRDFPFSICSSRDEEIVHGFPSVVSLKAGEILSIDFGVLYKGWYGDAAFTKAIGDHSKKAKKLIKVTKQCLYDGIEMARVGNRLGDIGHAVQTRAELNGFSVVKEFVGHGIGRDLHEDPQILNYGEPDKGVRLKAGMVIAIEPMVCVGAPETHTMPDGWTTVTKDHSLSAHWEHTLVVTDDGPVILTNRD